MSGDNHYDFIVIGSGFGGSVAALRLSEKGYRVLVIEQGLRFGRNDFAQGLRDLRRWMWAPEAGAKGILQLSMFEHLTVVHGVGVGGGSLVYACTHPTPKDPFFRAPSWSRLADWKRELMPHYETALKMLGAVQNPCDELADRVTREIAQELGRSEHYEKTRVAIYFGEPGKEVPDPYFGGKGPSRVGCTQCGGCMSGCRVGAKNSLDQNYLYLAERLGCEILPETKVVAVRALDRGYRVETRRSTDGREPRTFSAERVVFAAGVLGTVSLLLRMKEDPEGLPKLSERVGDFVRTNSESAISVYSEDHSLDLSKGIAISSILHTDDNSHVEPVRAGLMTMGMQYLFLPHAPGESLKTRLLDSARLLMRYRKPFLAMKRDRRAAQRTTLMLYMQTLDSTLRLRLGRSPYTGFRRRLVTALDPGSQKPRAFIKEATDIAWRFARKVNGVPLSFLAETMMDTATTAHVLGGACMGQDPSDGVIDAQHRVFNYPGLYVVDGAAVSANPGVNPALTITALAERAMSFIEAKQQTRLAAE